MGNQYTKKIEERLGNIERRLDAIENKGSKVISLRRTDNVNKKPKKDLGPGTEETAEPAGKL